MTEIEKRKEGLDTEAPPIWLRCFDLNNGLSPKTILTHLGRLRVVEPLPAARIPNGTGIVAFDAATPEVCDFIHETSRSSAGRVLALASNEAALAGGLAWRLLDAGASDVLVWHSLSDPAQVIAARLQRWHEVDLLLESPLVRQHIAGQSLSWRVLLRQVIEAARFTDSPILLMGETGTGKELVAHLIHSLDLQRSAHELIVLDCTTIVPELSGSELFGHEKGAFTGAIQPRDGAFALSNQGSLFLDEVGELPLSLQVQLLRVLQEHTYKRVGSDFWRRTDFRLICATNRDLLFEEAQGRFRRDLYYRLAAWSFKLPPLRERPEDIIPLAEHFIRLACPESEPPQMDERVRQYLVSRDYPGNVRDLRNLVFRMVSRHVGPGLITAGDIPSDERPISSLQDWRDESLDQIVRRALAMGVEMRELTNSMKETAIRVAIDYENGSLSRAANRLGVSNRSLQLWCAEHATRA